ncbi:hypothetical protein, partial [Salmonella enterica]|uniref:hypothetical protein n=1 Tax=Salmonella enterica TaxID=28901 RepID=UPI003523DD52
LVHRSLRNMMRLMGTKWYQLVMFIMSFCFQKKQSKQVNVNPLGNATEQQCIEQSSDLKRVLVFHLGKHIDHP